MKLKKIIGVVTATIALALNVCVVFAQVPYVPWGKAGCTVYAKPDARWYQWVEYTDANINIQFSTNKKFDSENFYPAVPKLYSTRDAVYQVTKTESSYPTYFATYIGNAGVNKQSATVAVVGAGAKASKYNCTVNAGTEMCMGYNKSPKETRSYVFKGVWSPDSYIK